MDQQTDGTFHQFLAKGIRTAIRTWAGWNPKRILSLLNRYRIFKTANKHREELLEKQNLVVPPLIIFSPTMECNLTCDGCYSRNYPIDGEMSLKEIKKLFQEAQDLGVGFFVITGGEPLLREGLLDLLFQHKKLIFFLFTNGSFIDHSLAKKVGKSNNIVPIFSVEGKKNDTNLRRGEGVHEQVMENMAYLNEIRAFFGFSAMITTKNLPTLEKDDFFDDMIQRGCRIGFCIGYVPNGPGADYNLVLSQEQQSEFREHILNIQQNKSLILTHLPDDEYEIAGTCMAAGRGFLHVNAQGYVEPCPFAHIATDTVKSKSLREALQSPLFSHIREHSELLKLPHLGCALYENRDKLNAVADQLGAISTENTPVN